MTDRMDRPFSRLYAQLRREAGDDAPAETDGDADSLVAPKLANPRRTDAES